MKRLKHSSFGDWFNHTEIQKEWNLYLNGNNQNSFYIWQWVNTALLISKFNTFE